MAWPAMARAQGFTIIQVTDTSGASLMGAAIDGAGTRLAIFSDRDLTPGSPGNADGNPEIFLHEIGGGTFTQITNTTGPVNFPPLIDAAGTRIAFPSTHDLTPGSPGNADGNAEIFLHEIITGRFTQVTNSTVGFNLTPAIDATGTRIAFRSTADLTPGNPGNADESIEIFLAIETASIPTLARWGQLAMVALLLVGGLEILRRRAAGARPGRQPQVHARGGSCDEHQDAPDRSVLRRRGRGDRHAKAALAGRGDGDS